MLSGALLCLFSLRCVLRVLNSTSLLFTSRVSQNVIGVQINKDTKLNLSYARLFCVDLSTSSTIYYRRVSVWPRELSSNVDLPLVSIWETADNSRLGGKLIYLPIALHVHILTSARSTSNLYAGGINWHRGRHERVPGGYEVTFYFNPLIHLLSLMFWCNTGCKLYFDIP